MLENEQNYNLGFQLMSKNPSEMTRDFSGDSDQFFSLFGPLAQNNFPSQFQVWKKTDSIISGEDDSDEGECLTPEEREHLQNKFIDRIVDDN